MTFICFLVMIKPIREAVTIFGRQLLGLDRAEVRQWPRPSVLTKKVGVGMEDYNAFRMYTFTTYKIVETR